jgi:major type 1 subunit fimbrin (pilin)
MKKWIESNRKPRRSMLLQLLTLVLLLSSTKGAWASCSFASGFSTITINVPISGTYTLPRDVAVGTVITTFTWKPSNTNQQYAICNGSGTRYWSLPSTPYTPSVGGIYPTNLAGIGVKVSNGVAGSVFPYSLGYSGGSVGFTWGGQTLVYSLVVTASPTSGIISGSQLPTVQYRFDSAPIIYNASAVGSVVIQVAACTTPDVLVPLGTHSPTEMASLGAGTALVGFSIKLNSCAAGMNSIKYRIDPVTTVINSGLSVVALDGSSSASGVGVQLLNSAGTAAFPLSSYQTFSGYSRTTGGTYSIPLNARYYRTGTITPGTANTSMTFTMQYQ